jgi:hypothetical protein
MTTLSGDQAAAGTGQSSVQREDLKSVRFSASSDLRPPRQHCPGPEPDSLSGPPLAPASTAHQMPSTVTTSGHGKRTCCSIGGRSSGSPLRMAVAPPGQHNQVFNSSPLYSRAGFESRIFAPIPVHCALSPNRPAEPWLTSWHSAAFAAGVASTDSPSQGDPLPAAASPTFTSFTQSSPPYPIAQSHDSRCRQSPRRSA